jgi:hypothetical protein
MIRCKELVKIVSSSTEHLSWAKRMEIKLHLMMCTHCTRYVAHLEALAKVFSSLIRNKTTIDRSKIIQIEDEAIKRAAKSPGS